MCAAFLDLSKAFDSINHRLLLRKLTALGFDHNSVALIENYLTDREQCVNVNDVDSDWISLTRGVPQGTVLGPLLFNLYVNDKNEGNKCTILQYADDTVLLSVNQNTEEAFTYLQ